MTHKDFLVNAPQSPLLGTARLPGDKSISHRAVMLASLAEGDSRITGFLMGEDTLATMRAFGQMGVKHVFEDQVLVISGVGMHGLNQPSAALDMGNSGTGMRLLSGILAGQEFSSQLTGDGSLLGRPMSRIVTPLMRMGASIDAQAKGLPPLSITPAAQGLQAISYTLPVASAQVKSAIMLAGLYATGTTEVLEPEPTRDHTERMLRAFSWAVDVDGPRVRLQGGGKLLATNIDVPVDISSAAFLIVAASIVPGSELCLEGVGINARRDGVLAILELMGADISLRNERTQGGEVVADITVRAAPLHGINVPQEYIASAIDEFPVLFVAAACAKGQTRIRNVAELRVKESDRIKVMSEGLRIMGCGIVEHADGVDILGGQLHAGVVDSQGDHRCAMAFAVAALKTRSQVRVLQVDNVATSFPGFNEQMSALGAVLELAPAAGVSA